MYSIILVGQTINGDALSKLRIQKLCTGLGLVCDLIPPCLAHLAVLSCFPLMLSPFSHLVDTMTWIPRRSVLYSAHLHAYSCDAFRYSVYHAILSSTDSIIILCQRAKKTGAFCVHADRCPSRENKRLYASSMSRNTSPLRPLIVGGPGDTRSSPLDRLHPICFSSD
jgi:hypothetical protein